MSCARAAFSSSVSPPSGAAAAGALLSTLGAGPVRRLREITLPLLTPALSAAAALTFLFCFTSFGVVLILGGPTRSTLETAIYDQAARAFDLRAAAALSLLQLVAVGLVLTIASRLESRIDGVRDLADELERPGDRAVRRVPGKKHVSASVHAPIIHAEFTFLYSDGSVHD
jgi:thiamine transport system permease protein